MKSISGKPPFFVLGSQRSGTTLLRLMLNSHSQLAIPYETGFITAFTHDTNFRTPFLNKVAEYGDLSDPANMSGLLDEISRFSMVRLGELISSKSAILARDVKTYPELVDAIMHEYALEHGKSRWGDKTPEYTDDIDILCRLFPGCKIIHLVRDGRGVALSQLRIKKAGWFAKSLPLLAERWRWKTTICHRVGSVLGADRYLELHYEDLIMDSERELRAICDFLEEPFEPAMLDYYKTAEATLPSHAHSVHVKSFRPPDPSNTDLWKRELPQADRIIFEQIAGTTLELFGYELEGLPSTLSSKLKSLYYTNFLRW